MVPASRSHPPTLLARLQDKVHLFTFEEVEEIVQCELGARISKAFSSFDSTPLAAASLGQVHSAALRDGRAVVVKVQRPRIRQQIIEDFEVLEELAKFFDDSGAADIRENRVCAHATGQWHDSFAIDD